MNRSRELAVGVLCAAAFLFMVIVRQYCTWEMPNSPDASTGETVAVLVNYGRIVYVTPLVQKLLYGSYILFGVTVVAFVVTFVFARPARNKQT